MTEEEKNLLQKNNNCWICKKIIDEIIIKNYY